MDTSYFDDQITKLEPQIEDLRKEMEAAQRKLLDAITVFLQGWYRETIEAEVKANPDLTKKLNTEGRLPEVKAKLNDLITKTSDHVEALLNVDRYWSHRGELPSYENWYANKMYSERRYSAYGQNFPDEVDEPVRSLLGLAGDILNDYGYVDQQSLYIQGRGHWSSNYHRRTEKSEHIAGLTYNSRHYKVTDEVTTALGNYSAKHDQFVKLGIQLQKIKQEKAEAIAGNLWDNA